MNKTIKIIDLLNKIANGEEVPKTIKYEDQLWKYNPYNDFEGLDYGGLLLNHVCLNELNNTVEIIEDNDKTDEEAKPITKESIEALGYACGEFQKCLTNGWTKALENKPLKGNDKLEKIKWNEKESRAGILTTDQEIEVLARRTEKLKKKIAELIDHINKIEKKLEEDK